MPNFKLYYRAIAIKTSWYKKQIWRAVEQNKGTRYESTNYAHLVFDKGAKNIWWRKYNLFNKCSWGNLNLDLP
jgi:hypothetical protein